MLQGGDWSDQFRRVIGAQTDSAAPTGSMSLRLVGLGSFTLCLVRNAAGLFRLLGCRKVSRRAFCLTRRLTGFVRFRSEERRGGKECVRPYLPLWSSSHYITNIDLHYTRADVTKHR